MVELSVFGSKGRVVLHFFIADNRELLRFAGIDLGFPCSVWESHIHFFRHKIPWDSNLNKGIFPFFKTIPSQYAVVIAGWVSLRFEKDW